MAAWAAPGPAAAQEPTAVQKTAAQGTAAQEAGGPSYTQHHWTTEDGLPVNSVRDIAEGPQGYLWLVTYDGLVRFDGVEFAEMSGGNSGLPTSQIAKVHEGPEGQILARTETGTVARIDPERPAVTHLIGPGGGPESGPGDGPLASEVLSVRVAGDSALWLRSEHAIYRWRGSDSGRSEAGWTAVMPDTTTAQVMQAGPRGGLWVGTEQAGLWRVRGGTARPVAARTPSGRPVRRTDALAVHDGPAGRSVRVASGTRLFRLEEGSRLEGRFTPLPPAAQPLQDPAIGLSTTPGGTLWAYTEEGALHAVADGGARRIGGGPVVGRRAVQTGPEGARWTKLGRQVRRNGEVVLAAEGRVQALTPDREGNWWVGTGRDGLYRLRRTPITMIDDGDGLPSSNVYGVNVRRSDSSEVWVTSIDGGLATVESREAKKS